MEKENATISVEFADLKRWRISQLAFFDIECVKERADDGVAPFRFRTYMVGLVYLDERGVVCAKQFSGKDEQKVLDDFAKFIVAAGIQRLGYAATRDFDVNVLRGLWTSARRAMAEEPRRKYPFVEEMPAPAVNYRRLWKDLPRADRTDDLNGYLGMAEWKRGDPEGKCARHNLLDLREMVLWAVESGL